MGSRILTEKLNKKICNIDFKNYGSHSDEKCNLPYLTVAVAMGMQKKEIDIFLDKLGQSF